MGPLVDLVEEVLPPSSNVSSLASSSAMTLPSTSIVTPKKKKTKCPPHFEIPAARLSCLTSSSLRPKLGLCILSIALPLAVVLVLVPLVADSPKMTSTTAKTAELKDAHAVEAVAAANQVREASF